MMNNNTPNESGNFSPRQVSVLIEEFRGEFRVFGEGLENLNSKFDNLDKKFEGMRANQARTLERITGIELRIDSIEVLMNKRFDSVEIRLDRLEASTI